MESSFLQVFIPYVNNKIILRHSLWTSLQHGRRCQKFLIKISVTGFKINGILYYEFSPKKEAGPGVWTNLSAEGLHKYVLFDDNSRQYLRQAGQSRPRRMSMSCWQNVIKIILLADVKYLGPVTLVYLKLCNTSYAVGVLTRKESIKTFPRLKQFWHSKNI
jgi:hypothetical protein